MGFYKNEGGHYSLLSLFALYKGFSIHQNFSRFQIPCGMLESVLQFTLASLADVGKCFAKDLNISATSSFSLI